MNPYASPLPEALTSSDPSAGATPDLVRLLPAVRYVAVAVGLLILGYLFGCVSSVVTYLHFLNIAELKDSVSITLNLVAALRQLLVSLALIYVLIVVWKYASVIKGAIRTGSVNPSLLASAQRRCWYAIASLALLLFLISVTSPAITYALYALS
jgi:hypothetical protein